MLIVLRVDGLRFGQWPADHLGKLLHPGAVDFGEIDCLRVLARQASDFRGEQVKVRIRIVAVAFGRLAGAGQVADTGVMRDQPEFLLAAIDGAPRLPRLRQKGAANERPQFLVAGRHLLQRRVGIGESERLGPAVFGAKRINFGVDAIADEVRENVALEKLAAGGVVLVRDRY